MKNLNLKYKNITISGLPGAGSSTLGKALSKVLSWKYFSGGDFSRTYAIKHGFFSNDSKAHHSAAVYGPKLDRKLDYGMRDWLTNKKGYILDAWISGFFAQGVVGTLKILMRCDDALRIDRIVNRDDLAVSDAKKHIFNRQEENLDKWSKLYAKEWKKWVVDKGKAKASKPIFFWKDELYDLVIDTYSQSKEQALRTTLAFLGFSKKVDYKKIFENI
jgi:cytidylate kinase